MRIDFDKTLAPGATERVNFTGIATADAAHVTAHVAEMYDGGGGTFAKYTPSASVKASVEVTGTELHGLLYNGGSATKRVLGHFALSS